METEAAQDKADEALAKVKELEHDNLKKDQEISSLTHKNSLLEAEVESLEAKLTEAKGAAEEGAAHGTVNENLNRKINLFEEELEASDQKLRETTEKLRLTDVRAEQFERKVTSLETAVEDWEKKYEELNEKYITAKNELDEITRSLEAI